MNYEEYSITGSAHEFMYKVYGWMAIALVLTAFSSYWVVSTPGVYLPLMKNMTLFIVLLIVQFALVIVLSSRIKTLSFSSAVIMFMIYSLFSGITLSSIFFVYTFSSIAKTFFICAGMFGCMSIYGYYTKANLMVMRSFLVMALCGLLIAMVVNMFFNSAQMDYFISLVGVGLFTLFTAYDVQKTKRLGESLFDSAEDRDKIGIICALGLYLDFINLFLHLLRLLGRRRD